MIETKEEMTSDTHKLKSYLDICELASNDMNVFNIFKSHKDYIPVLEHVSYLEGLGYLEELKNIYTISPFLINDKYGSPTKYLYPQGEFSPTTLRYIKVSVDLHNIFGNNIFNNPINIVEIGGGYGGQSLIIHRNNAKINTYKIIDLPPVNKLIKKYTEINGIYVILIDALNTEEIKRIEPFDLLISNYAFCECNEQIRKLYLDNVIAKSKYGYMTINGINNIDKQKLYDYMTNVLNKKITIIDEKPLTCIGTKIITWQ